MTSNQVTLSPNAVWAQRNDVIFLTIQLEDCKDPSIKLEENNVTFKGNGGPDKKEYTLNVDLYEAIDADKSIHSVRDRAIEFILKKKEDGPYWPRLTKSTTKHHWLKIDFNKWVDEDESGDEGGPMGGGGMPGGMGMMPGMGGMAGMPGMGGMGGMGSMPGFGGGDGGNFEEMMRQMGGLGGGGGADGKPSLDDLDKESDSDDEDLPDLE